MKTDIKKLIRGKLKRNENLTAKQVQYVKDHIEFKYENDCKACRFNVLISLGTTVKKAFQILGEI